MHHELGLDILDFFRGILPWGKLHRMLGRLPQGSQYWAARADDDEAADQYLDTEDAKKPRKPQQPPALGEMNYANQVLTHMANLLTSMGGKLDVLGGAKPDRMTLLPHAVTALDRAKRRRALAAADDLIEEVKDAMRRSEERKTK